MQDKTHLLQPLGETESAQRLRLAGLDGTHVATHDGVGGAPERILRRWWTTYGGVDTLIFRIVLWCRGREGGAKGLSCVCVYIIRIDRANPLINENTSVRFNTQNAFKGRGLSGAP